MVFGFHNLSKRKGNYLSFFYLLYLFRLNSRPFYLYGIYFKLLPIGLLVAVIMIYCIPIVLNITYYQVSAVFIYSTSPNQLLSVERAHNIPISTQVPGTMAGQGS